MKTRPTFSIIMLTRKRGPLFEKSVNALAHQTPRPALRLTELIIIDTTVGTLKQSLKRQFGPKRVRHIHFRKRGISLARNYAVSIARGTYICFIDDDTVVDSLWLNTLTNAVQKHPKHIIFGQILPTFNGHAHQERLLSIEEVTPWVFTSVKASNPKSIWPYAVNVCIPKNVFRRWGMFSEVFANEEGPVKHPYGEDPEFFSRVIASGVRVHFEPRLKCFHYLDDKRLSVAYLAGRYLDDGKNSVLGFVHETEGIWYFRIFKFIARDMITVIRQHALSNPYTFLYVCCKFIGECLMVYYLFRFSWYYRGRIRSYAQQRAKNQGKKESS